MAADDSRACPVCSGQTIHVGTGLYYTSERRFATPFTKCHECDLYIREVGDDDLAEHVNATSYVRLTNEEKFFASRSGFFEHLLSILKRHTRGEAGLKLVDFGCSYGHLLRLAKQSGFECVGIEIAAELRQKYAETDEVVLESMADLPDGYTDVVTFVDSLYLCKDPVQKLREAARILKSSGVILLRVTNRNWVVTMRKLVGIRDLSVLGDALVSYSPQSIPALLSAAGLSLIRMLPDSGRGKEIGFKRKVFYAACGILSRLLPEQAMLAPGIIVVCRKGSFAPPVQ